MTNANAKKQFDEIITAEAAATIIYGDTCKKDKTRSVIKLIKTGALGGGQAHGGQWVTSRQQIQKYFEVLMFQSKARFTPSGNRNGGSGKGSGKNGKPCGNGKSGSQGNFNTIGNDGSRADYNATLKAAINAVHGQHGSNKN